MGPIFFYLIKYRLLLESLKNILYYAFCRTKKAQLTFEIQQVL